MKFQEDLKSDMQPYTLVTLSSNDHTFRNAALLHGQWVHEITWTEGNIYRFNLDKPIVIDLNDPSLVFEGSTLALLDRTANGESPLANIPEASSFVTAAPSKIIGSKFNVSNDGSNKYAIGATNAAIVGRSEVQHAVFVKELDNVSSLFLFVLRIRLQPAHFFYIVCI